MLIASAYHIIRRNQLFLLQAQCPQPNTVPMEFVMLSLLTRIFKNIIMKRDIEHY